ncbi:GDSL-type esterase/lipase family protein [Parachryseolinea silvisoli]|uniref:GDSL-type esterase/lipase family protein n=1 Tax=Parachryseolinea silvisoli TaxID=2873601 RepID=UPI002265A82B|nr:GDSL-type esterase/lipase family protein [Parachryseolinea silvisoli]MCD9017951.1 T9SS type A sorting domain-containing protein [Parachryseolinea silvisoli]
MKKLILILLVASVNDSMAQKLNVVDPVKFLALGDSYTIGESVAPAERWPVQLAEAFRQKGLACPDPTIIATTGWRTDNLKDAIQQAHLKPEYTLVSLLIGVNNYYQGKSVEAYGPEFEGLLSTAIALAGGQRAHVFVVSIPDYGYTPFGKDKQTTITLGIDRFNAANKAIAIRMGVPYIDITEISRRGLADADLVAGDGLHPSGKMYTAWTALILEHLKIARPADEGNNTSTTPENGIRDARYSLKVYPNPFHDILQVQSHAAPSPNRRLSLLTSTGETVKNIKLDTQGTILIPTADLAVGTYFLLLRDQDTEVLREPIVKQ